MMKRLLLLMVIAIMSLQANFVEAEVHSQNALGADMDDVVETGIGQLILVDEYGRNMVSPNGKTAVDCGHENFNWGSRTKMVFEDDRTNTTDAG